MNTEFTKKTSTQAENEGNGEKILLISMLAVIVIGVALAVIGGIVNNQTLLAIGIGLVMFVLVFSRPAAGYMSDRQKRS